MEGRDPTRPPSSIYESCAEYALRVYRSYRPYVGESIVPIVSRFYQLWERTHQYGGATELDGIHRLISVLPKEWRAWAAWMSSSYIYRRIDTQEEVGDFRGFVSFVFIHSVHYPEAPSIPEGDLPPPPLQWCSSIPPESGTQGLYDHEAGSSRQPVTDLPPGTNRQVGVHQRDGAGYDPEGRGKAPMVATDEEEGLGEPWMDFPVVTQERAPEREGQMLEVHEPPRVHVWGEDFHVSLRRWSEERLAWLRAIRAEMDLEEALFPVDEVPQLAHEDLPGAVADDPILVEDSDDDFEGSSGVSSEGSDGEQ